MVTELLKVPRVKKHAELRELIHSNINEILSAITLARANKKAEMLSDSGVNEDIVKRKIDSERLREMELINTDMLYDLFYEFYTACKEINSTLSRETIIQMFNKFVSAVYLAKLEIFDTRNQKSVPMKVGHLATVVHEGKNRIIWTRAQQNAVENLRNVLDEAFRPLLENLPAPKINLWMALGSERADKLGASMTLDHPSAYIMDKLEEEYISEVLFPAYALPSSPDYVTDLSLFTILWSALSTQYVMRFDGQDVDVFLPEGEIATSSIFWNYEFNILRKTFEALGTEGNFNFYKLTSDAQRAIKDLNHECEALRHAIGINEKRELLLKKATALLK